jgi:hypothetical protein
MAARANRHHHYSFKKVVDAQVGQSSVSYVSAVGVERAILLAATV